jgi:hypothetical protein
MDAYGLTEKELLTIPHEHITHSRQAFFPLDEVEELCWRKFEAGICHDPPTLVNLFSIRVFMKVKMSKPNCNTKHKNWSDERGKTAVCMRVLKEQKERKAAMEERGE